VAPVTAAQVLEVPISVHDMAFLVMNAR
jgi:hypothetical protein